MIVLRENTVWEVYRFEMFEPGSDRTMSIWTTPEAADSEATRLETKRGPNNSHGYDVRAFPVNTPVDDE